MSITVTSIKPQEIETGCSLNGKILYEKTLFGTKVGGTDLDLLIGNNIDFAYIYGGGLITPSNTIYNLNRYEPANTTFWTRCEISILNNSTAHIYFKSGTNNEYFNGQVIITVRYTKIT